MWMALVLPLSTVLQFGDFPEDVLSSLRSRWEVGLEGKVERVGGQEGVQTGIGI